MKIFVPIDSFDEAEVLINSGADELFCCVWLDNMFSGTCRPNNNRAYIKNLDELLKLKEYTSKRGVNLWLTLNKHTYTPEELNTIRKHIPELLKMDGWIITNINLLMDLSKEDIKIASGSELYCMNKWAAAFLKNQGVKRIILDRQMTLNDLKTITAAHPDIEFEAFVMNSNCRSINAFCRFRAIKKPGKKYEHPCNFSSKIEMIKDEGISSRIISRRVSNVMKLENISCGACALYYFKKYGISAVKIVGRGKSTEKKHKDVRFIKNCMNLLEKSTNFKQYCSHVKKIFKDIYLMKCDKKFCYYPHFFEDGT